MYKYQIPDVADGMNAPHVLSTITRRPRSEPQNTRVTDISTGTTGLTQLPPSASGNEPTPVAQSPMISAARLDGGNQPLTTSIVIPPQLSLETTNPESSLHDALWDARIHCELFDYFVPLSELDKLITVSAVEKVIRSERPTAKAEDVRKYAEKTWRSAKSLFAILVLLKKGETICSLLDDDICDKDLPLVTDSKDGQWLLSRKGAEQLIDTFKEWRKRDREEFARYQWWMIAPRFEKEDRTLQEFADPTILPYISIKKKREENNDGIPFMKIGGYSEVTAFRVHPAHHDFWDYIALEYQPLIADKKLLTCDKIEFLKEKIILDMLGPKNHPHLIKLLASYRHKQYYHLIFPCADGNLRNYWARDELPHFDKETLLWSVRQMAGIADGICHIHAFRVPYDLDVDNKLRLQDGGVKLSVREGEQKFGRHGDIRPENILWFSGESALKITDFGLGRFHGRDSRSGIDPRKVTHSPTYEPPECRLSRPVSRVYDIWSLGCIFLEFVTWLLGGSKQIDAFSDARGYGPVAVDENGISDDNFYTIFSDENHEKDAKVRDAVVQWVNLLHEDKMCPDLIHDLLDMIMEKLLKTNPNERVKATELVKDMNELVRRAESEESYLIRPNPRPSPAPITLAPITSISSHNKLSGKTVRFREDQQPLTTQPLTTSKSWPLGT